jgi:hypothetical protein
MAKSGDHQGDSSEDFRAILNGVASAQAAARWFVGCGILAQFRTAYEVDCEDNVPSAPPQNQTSIHNIMANNNAMEKALDTLKSQEKPNSNIYISEEFGVNRTTRMMRFKGRRVSREEAVSTHLKLLANAQESKLPLTI